MKLIKKVITILMINILGIIALTGIVSAKNIPTSAKLYSGGEVPQLLRYAEIPQETKYVFHKYNGVEYPAYCLNQTLPGVTSSNQYDVTIDGEITDNMVWKIIVNGYPYKTIEELGCSSKMEAYAATQHAIYSYKLNNLNGEDYMPLGESGTRVLTALRNILKNAQNSTVVSGKDNKIYYGKAPSDSLQNYALTGIVEKEEEPEIKTEDKPVVKTEEKKLPKTGM